jgi:hypothetical protein
MTNGRLRPRVVRALALAVCLPAVLAGCGSGGGSSAAPADHASNGTGSSVTSKPASPGSGQPAWVQSLGPGVTVTGPAAPPPPGARSPAAAVMGSVRAAEAGDIAAECSYFQVAYQSQCRSIAAQAPSGSKSKTTLTGFALGYVAVDGDKALVGMTGEVCTPGNTPACVTNNNPAAIFSSGKPFAALWAQEVAADAPGTPGDYSLLPCLKTGQDWYNYWPLSGSGGPGAD